MIEIKIEDGGKISSVYVRSEFVRPSLYFASHLSVPTYLQFILSICLIFCVDFIL